MSLHFPLRVLLIFLALCYATAWTRPLLIARRGVELQSFCATLTSFAQFARAGPSLLTCPKGASGELDVFCGENEKLEILGQEFPNAHPMELRRFLRKVSGDLFTARANYAAHLEWRQATSPDVVGTAGTAKVPRWMWIEDDGGLAGNKTKTLWVQGALFDSSAASVDNYVLATTRVLDGMFQRSNEDKAYILVDTAAYVGMNNEPATRVLLYARKVASILNKHYPGRMQRLVIFPVPSWGVYVWNSISPLLPSRTAAKVELRSDPPPSALPILQRLANTPV